VLTIWGEKTQPVFLIKGRRSHMTIVIMVMVIIGMITGCYFTSGLSNTAGTIFERKSTVAKKQK
jgi:hypothetical protein